MHMQTVTRAVETTKQAQDIEILKHIEFQYGRSKIQDSKIARDNWKESWIQGGPH